MKIGGNLKALLVISGVLLLMAALFFAGRSGLMGSDINWHLRFQITDKTNVIAGARVRVSAFGKATAYDQVFHNVQLRQWYVNGVADAHGDYLLDIRASSLDITFKKDGYIDTETNIYGGNSAADATVKITLDHK